MEERKEQGFKIPRVLLPAENINLAKWACIACEDVYKRQLHIRKDQLVVDGRHVAQRVDAAVHMGDVVVLKAAYDLDDRVHLADVR